MKRKILYISGSRADYGLIRQALFAIKKNQKLQLEIAVTGMHLMPEFGNTILEIKKDGFKIHTLKAIYKHDDKSSMADFIGEFIVLANNEIKKIKPDIVLLLGDRAEMLAGAVAGAYLGIPVAHIHGGDVSSTVDDSVRHAITKLSLLHLAATKKSAERIIKMGEEAKRVFVVGAPGLDGVLNTPLIPASAIAKKYGVDLSRPLLLALQHPVTAEVSQAKNQMHQTMLAIKELGHQAVVIYPNADAGGREIIKVIETYKKYPFIKIYKNIGRTDFLSLMKVASVMVGNSSSGIIEAASFNVPVVNIGTRQEGRERANNVVDVDYKKMEIKKAIAMALKPKKKKYVNVYGNGKASQKISDVLSRVKIDRKFLDKKITY